MTNQRFRILFALFTGAYALVALFTAGDYGLSWDEPFRWSSGDAKLAYYEELAASDNPAELMRNARRDVYPGLYDVPLALVRARSSLSNFTLSRIWNVAFGYLGLASVVLLTRRLLAAEPSDGGPSGALERDWFPFAPALILVCCPEYYNHLFINPKDAPFAALYAMSLFALLGVVRDYPNPRLRSLVFLGVAIGLAMAIRPPGLILYCYFGLFGVLWIGVEIRSKGVSALGSGVGKLAGRSAIVGAVAFLTVFPWWPNLHRNPFTASTAAVSQLGSVAASKPVLFQGEFYEAGQTPFHYAVWMLVVKTPEWLFVLLLVSLAFTLFRFRKVCDRLLAFDRRAWMIFIVAASLVVPLLYVTFSGAAIHNGYRHMLYTLPPAAVLAALAWRELYKLARPTPRHRWGLVIVSCIAIGLSLINLVRLHPYQYIYYNALVGGTAGSYGRYETDYWFTAGKEGAEALNAYLSAQKLGVEPATLYVLGPPLVVDPFLDERIQIIQTMENADFYMGRPMRDERLENSKMVHGIDRGGVPLLVVLDLRDR